MSNENVVNEIVENGTLEYQEETVSIPKSKVIATINALVDAIENTDELLRDHLAALGETTRKNKFVADVYGEDLAKIKSLHQYYVDLLKM